MKIKTEYSKCSLTGMVWNFIILYINVTGKIEELYEEIVYCMADGSGYDIDREQCINGIDICTN